LLIIYINSPGKSLVTLANDTLKDQLLLTLPDTDESNIVSR